MARTVEPLLGTRAEVSVSAAAPHARDTAEKAILAEATPEDILAISKALKDYEEKINQWVIK